MGLMTILVPSNAETKVLHFLKTKGPQTAAALAKRPSVL